MQIKIIFQRYVITEVITFDIIERHFKHTYVKYKNQYNHITPHGSNIACYIFVNKSWWWKTRTLQTRAAILPPPPSFLFYTRPQGPPTRARALTLCRWDAVGGMEDAGNPDVFCFSSRSGRWHETIRRLYS